jgi:hypothetical protein
MNQDDLIEALGRSQQKVMSLTVAKMALAKRLEVAETRAEILEELVMDIVADCREGARGYEIEERITKVMQKLDGDQ